MTKKRKYLLISFIILSIIIAANQEDGSRLYKMDCQQDRAYGVWDWHYDDKYVYQIKPKGKYEKTRVFKIKKKEFRKLHGETEKKLTYIYAENGERSMEDPHPYFEVHVFLRGQTLKAIQLGGVPTYYEKCRYKD